MIMFLTRIVLLFSFMLASNADRPAELFPPEEYLTEEEVNTITQEETQNIFQKYLCFVGICSENKIAKDKLNKVLNRIGFQGDNLTINKKNNSKHHTGNDIIEVFDRSKGKNKIGEVILFPKSGWYTTTMKLELDRLKPHSGKFPKSAIRPHVGPCIANCGKK